MDLYDAEKAARVWQRVHAPSDSLVSPEGLSGLLLQLRQMEAIYRILSRQATAAYSAPLRSLSDRKRVQATCVRGLHILTAGPCPDPAIPNSKTESLSATLRRCYAAEMQILTQFDLHSTDPTCGPVFSALTPEQRQNCKTIATIIGQLER